MEQELTEIQKASKLLQEHNAQLEGLDYLAARAADPRTASAFLTLVGKTLPLTVKGPGANGEHTFQKIVVEIVKADK